jgi:hypothetical protein
VVGSPTVLNNGGSVGQALINNNYIYGARTRGAAEIINNSGRVDKASVSNNNIILEEGSSEASNQPQATADTPPLVAPYFAGRTGQFIRTRGENTDLYAVENDVSGNVTFLDNSGSLDGTSISGNHINSTNQILNNSGQADHMYIANNDVRQTVTNYQSDSSGGSETIPSDMLNGHRVQNRNGTFHSAISLSPTVPIRPDYVTVALKGKNFLGVYFDSDPRIGKLRQVPIAGYTIMKLIRPSVPLKIVVFQSQPDCLCEGIISWGMSNNTAQAR